MTWTLLAEDWPNAQSALENLFPFAGAMHPPENLSDVAQLLSRLAEGHDLTFSEAAHALDDFALTRMSHMQAPDASM